MPGNAKFFDMRIPTILEKISALAAQPEKRSAIDVDLMLDYTRVLYADLLEWRSRITAAPAMESPANGSPLQEAPKKALVKEAPPLTAPPRPEPPKPVVTPPREVSAPAPPPPSLTAAAVMAAPPPPARDIRSLIGINDKYQIMSELFGNDKTAYEEALDFINGCKNESSAMAWLRERLWIAEERSDAALSFFDLVSRHFRC